MTAATEHILVGVSDEGSYDMRYTLPLSIEVAPDFTSAVLDFIQGYRIKFESAQEEELDYGEEIAEEDEASWGEEKFRKQFMEDLLAQSGVVQAHFLEFVDSFE